MADVTIKGADELEAVARALKAAGNGDLRKEMLRGIRNVGKPFVADVRASALHSLPKRGGLAEVVAGSKFSTRTRVSGKQVGVRFVGTNRHDVEAIDQGTLRHPVFGHKVWVRQSITPGWFTKPVEKSAPDFRRGIEGVLTDVANKIGRSA